MATTLIKPRVDLRDYQVKAIEAVKDSMEQGETSGLLYLATGLGKTVIASALAKELNLKTLFIVHREELAIQTLKKMILIYPEATVGIVQGKNNQLGRKVTIASIQTLCSPKRLEQVLENGDYKLIIIDECHHYSSGEWKVVIDKFNGYKIGLTATPNRSDNIALNSVFNRILYRYSIVEGIKNAHLVDIEGIRYKINANFNELNLQSGDYKTSELSSLMATPEVIMETYKAWETYSKEKKTIVFCVSIDHVNSLTEYFLTKNIRASSIIGETSSEERSLIYRDFETGKIQVLISCMVLTEGFDEPSVETVLCARPTISESLYIQMIGRGLRQYPNKDKCLVIDLVGNSDKHRLMQLGILFGLDQKKKEKAEKLAKEYGIEPEVTEDWETIESVMSIIGTGEKMSVQKISDTRQFEWIETKKGLVLSLGNKFGFLIIEREEGMNFHKIVHCYSASWRDKKDDLADSLPLDWAVTIAEREAQRFLAGNGTGLIDKNAEWRNTEPSQKQIEILNRLGCTEIPATKGKCSDLMTKLFSLEKINGYDLANKTPKGSEMLNRIIDLKTKEELTVNLGKKNLEKLSYNEANRILLFHHKNLENNY